MEVHRTIFVFDVVGFLKKFRMRRLLGAAAACAVADGGRASASWCPYPPQEGSPVVFFDVSVEQEPLGRVFIELFADAAPKAAENFRSLCTGERGSARWVRRGGTKCPLFYKGVPFHRIIPGFVVQGGDIVHSDGRGNESVFGYLFPEDEGFERGKAGRHLPGTVAMAPSAPGQVGSQFFFNLSRAAHLDRKMIVVGQVVGGWDVVQQVAKVGSRCGVPLSTAWISDCGQCTSSVHSHEQQQQQGQQQSGATRAPFRLPGKEVLDMLAPRYSGK